MKEGMGAGSLIMDKMPCSSNTCIRGGRNEEKWIVGDHSSTQDSDRSG